MKILRFLENGVPQLGVKQGNDILNVTAFAKQLQIDLPASIESTEDLQQIEQLVAKLQKEDTTSFTRQEEDLHFLPVVHRPEKIICVGVNYQAHAKESNLQVPDFPVLFNKFSNSLHGHNQPIVMPANAQENDYEAELAIVIGRKAKNVTKEDALQYVLGYSVANDASARDWQMRTSQWMLGKAVEQYCPVGPYLVTSDEIEDPQQLTIRCYLNGELRQNAHTSQMIFDCAEIISYLSAHMTLKPGDVILSGTPEGVIFGMDPATRTYLQHGDEVVVEIENVGTLRNAFIREE